VLGGGEVVIGDDQPGFEPRAVQRVVADGAQAAMFAGLPKAIPEAERELRFDKKFIAEVAGEAGAGNGYGAVS
jgi:hypothetical protein